jgi:hypothetical protein
MSISTFLESINEHDISYDIDSLKRLFGEFLNDNLDVYFEIGIYNNKVYLQKKPTIPQSTILSKCPMLIESCNRHSLELLMEYHQELNSDILVIH